VAGIDLLTLDLHAQLAARLDAAPADTQALAEDAAEDEAEPTGALQLAIELEESPIAEGAEGVPAQPAAADPA
jgi:exoribonuclease-2